MLAAVAAPGAEGAQAGQCSSPPYCAARWLGLCGTVRCESAAQSGRPPGYRFQTPTGLPALHLSCRRPPGGRTTPTRSSRRPGARKSLALVKRPCCWRAGIAVLALTLRAPAGAAARASLQPWSHQQHAWCAVQASSAACLRPPRRPFDAWLLDSAAWSPCLTAGPLLCAFCPITQHPPFISFLRFGTNAPVGKCNTCQVMGHDGRAA